MDILREAGFPVWAVLLLGTWSLIQAWRYRVGSIETAELVGPIVATLLVGALATAWGVQLALGAVRDLPDPSDGALFALIGVKEALYNLDFALGLSTLAVLAAVSGRRHGGVASAQ